MPTTNSPESGRLATALTGLYAVERELGRGGMGVVVLARDLRLDRLVALKTLPQHLADDPVVRERFLREARTAAALSHPRIVPIHHAAEVNGSVFFVMGFVDGGSVAQLMRDHGRVPAAIAVPLLIDVASALGYAHDRGVVHRDIKAENILIDTSNGCAMVTDFGIARLAEAAPMTATGTVLGTVHYMSPEQVNGEALDGRSDLYALGVLAFVMLSGRFPFENDAPSAVLVAHVTRQPPSLRSVAPQVPLDVADIVDRLLRKDPAERCASAAELVTILEAASIDEEQPAPRATESTPQVISSAAANEVWERAAQLQQLTGTHAPPPPVPAVLDRAGAGAGGTAGYRVDDVVAAAEEAGIEGKYVERALAERIPAAGTALATGVVRPGAVMDEKPSFWVGSPTRLEYESVVEGELHPDDYDELVDEMRRAFGEFGSASIVGRTITFVTNATTSSGTRRMQATVSSRAGRTTIRAFEDLRQVAHGMIGGISGGVGGGFGGAMAGLVMGTMQMPVLAVSVLLGIGTVAFASARFGVRRMSDGKRRDLVRAVERITAKAQELVNDRAVAPSPPPRRLKR